METSNLGRFNQLRSLSWNMAIASATMTATDVASPSTMDQPGVQSACITAPPIQTAALETLIPSVEQYAE